MNSRIKILITLLLITTGSFTGMSCKSEALREEKQISDVVAGLIAGAKNDEEKMSRIYYFVRDEIKFGWVYPQDISPREVLNRRRGLCMQKSNLLVAMAREAGLKARFHFMYVHKTALEDFLPEFAYNKWVDPFPHTFPEVYLNKKWVSMEATFDKELHDICIKKKLNFGKYQNIVNSISIEFSPHGVKGHQQFVHAEGKESFFGNDLSEFKKFMHEGVPWWKRQLQPFIFRKAQKIMDKIRETE
ncbi:MAG TPA: transglutaminase-like domain-containing protein [Spirochaetota bacterium]|nr:transglutaminase-like domain-containing protein [Spirochaetota bacterium]HPJ33722.1 transglutaminase-like domain-containing protein [Spirochaetota bacterium]